MEQAEYLPDVVAAFLSRTRVLRIYQNKSCLLSETIGGKIGDDYDYWNTIFLGDKVLDVNLYEEIGYSKPSLTAYPVVNNEVDCSTWQKIKLKVLPI